MLGQRLRGKVKLERASWACNPNLHTMYNTIWGSQGNITRTGREQVPNYLIVRIYCPEKILLTEFPQYGYEHPLKAPLEWWPLVVFYPWGKAQSSHVSLCGRSLWEWVKVKSIRGEERSGCTLITKITADSSSLFHYHLISWKYQCRHKPWSLFCHSSLFT